MEKNHFGLLIRPGIGPRLISAERRLQLKTAQEAVKGYVQQYFIREMPGFVLLCDEEGKLRGKDRCFYFDHQWFVGDVLLVKNHTKRGGDEEWRGFESELEARAAFAKFAPLCGMDAPERIE